MLITYFHNNVLLYFQKKNFVKFMKDTFPACKINNQTVDDVLDFITGCLNIVPGKRPTVQELQDHKIFGGTWQDTNGQVDIWKNKSEGFFFFLSFFILTIDMKCKIT